MKKAQEIIDSDEDEEEMEVENLIELKRRKPTDKRREDKAPNVPLELKKRFSDDLSQKEHPKLSQQL